MKKLLLVPIVTILLIGCGGGGGSSTPEKSTVFDESQKSFLYNLLQTEYLWYDQVSDDVNYSVYQEPQEMINALKYSTYDKWSYSETIKEYEDGSGQISEGFGCYYSGNKIKTMKINSPCYNSGLKRGDIVTKVNYQNATSEIYNAAQENLGVQSIFTIDRDGQELNVQITPLKYNYINTKSQVFTRTNGTKVGHMIFNEFSSTSADEVDEAFTYFKNNNIDELIIDLRYNSGGSLTTASILLDKIAGYNNEDAVQAYSKWNQNNSDKNSIYYFEKDNNSIDLNRVFFLTTDTTASASEISINNLKPYMDVKVIGSKTRGKPVGMRGRDKEGLIYWLINFSIYNVNNEGDFYNGINVDCSTIDNIDFERTDENGDMLSEALYYIDNGTCK